MKLNIIEVFLFSDIYDLKEIKVDLTAASTDDENEIAKLVVMSMHFTMVSRPREDIKKKTMQLLPEDQTVIEAMLNAIAVRDFNDLNNIMPSNEPEQKDEKIKMETEEQVTFYSYKCD